MIRRLLICAVSCGCLSAAFAQSSLVVEPQPLGAPSATKLVDKLAATYLSLQTLSADFTYSVQSKTRHQIVTGHARLMKPNFARLTFERIAEPAYPNLIASDGRQAYTFVPENYSASVQPLPSASHNSVLAAQQASGSVAGGQIKTAPVSHDGKELRLWDSIVLQAFFSVRAASEYFYAGRISLMTIEGTRVIDGVAYTVLYHHLSGGSIAGGAMSDFDQRVYIGPDGLIHMSVLVFQEAGAPGIQMMRLRNIKVNDPMSPESFIFTPPQ